MKELRKVEQIIEPQSVIEGAGVLLQRSFSPKVSNLFDPFLLFDHFAFNDPLEGPIRGFPTHPHRGIETVTYMLEGQVRHRDSLGNQGEIGAGAVQWMTSGRGILHEEMPQRGPGGVIYGFQLWVNLPAALKMSPPRYQEFGPGNIPSVEKDGLTLRIVAGEYAGVGGPATEIAAQPIYMEVRLEAGRLFEIDIPRGQTVLAYVFEGEGVFLNGEPGQGQPVSAVRMVKFEDGDTLKVRAAEDQSLRFMLIAGAPFGEPIAPYGPFVMTTQEEIRQALVELRNGTFVS
ncbi:MAG: pirin family protein [Anaerolineales bacterium]|jgi:redox-sensitive bicupin YhaK (pirin superfamily)|nr:pirin family protein [Anaerolineales bacterium]